MLQCKLLTWLSTARLSIPEESVHNDVGSSLYPEGFPGTQTPHLQGRVSNTWISSKNVQKGLACLAANTALGGSGDFTCRRGQRKTCEEGRLLCLSAYSTSTAMPTLPLLPAFSVSMPWTLRCLLFPLVRCRSTQHLP